MKTVVFLAVLSTASIVPPAMAQEPPKPAPAPQQDQRVELKQRIAARHSLLEKFRDAGKVGETADGQVKLVKAADGTEQVDAKDAAKGTIADLVDAENKDRRAVYEIVAKEEKTSVAEVAKQNGLSNLKRAKPEHWIEVKGQWVQRKSIRTEEKEKTDKGKDTGKE